MAVIKVIHGERRLIYSQEDKRLREQRKKVKRSWLIQEYDEPQSYVEEYVDRLLHDQSETGASPLHYVLRQQQDWQDSIDELRQKIYNTIRFQRTGIASENMLDHADEADIWEYRYILSDWQDRLRFWKRVEIELKATS